MLVPVQAGVLERRGDSGNARVSNSRLDKLTASSMAWRHVANDVLGRPQSHQLPPLR